MTVIYPDIEKVLVAYLQDALGAGVHVATKKVAPDLEQPEYQVVLTATYGSEKTPVSRFAGVVLEVYADSYADASDLALTVEAELRGIPHSSGPIKALEILSGPTRLGEETEQEKRSLAAEVVVKAATY